MAFFIAPCFLFIAKSIASGYSKSFYIEFPAANISKFLSLGKLLEIITKSLLTALMAISAQSFNNLQGTD